MGLTEWKKRKQMERGGMEVVDVPEESSNGEMRTEQTQQPKEGLIKKVDRGLTNLGTRFKEHKAKAPERQAAKLEKMKTQTSMLQEKQKMRDVKMSLYEAKQKRADSMGIKNPFGMGGSPMHKDMPSPMGMNNPFGSIPTVRKGQPHIGKAKAKKKKSNKKKSRGKSITINY